MTKKIKSAHDLVGLRREDLYTSDFDSLLEAHSKANGSDRNALLVALLAVLKHRVKSESLEISLAWIHANIGMPDHTMHQDGDNDDLFFVCLERESVVMVHIRHGKFINFGVIDLPQFKREILPQCVTCRNAVIQLPSLLMN